MPETTSETLEDADFELTFSPSLRLVSTVRAFVSEFYAETIGDSEISAKLALATHELLDNAVRYSLDGRTSLQIKLQRKPEDINVTINTRNRAVAVHLRAVQEAIDELAAAPDAEAHYLALMKRAKKLARGSSGLGLGRIRAEGDMAISCRIDADLVELCAEARFARSEP
jgi:anti-sigma regulatory factor (Ser/Thr protein kinase)